MDTSFGHGAAGGGGGKGKKPFFCIRYIPTGTRKAFIIIRITYVYAKVFGIIEQILRLKGTE